MFRRTNPEKRQGNMWGADCFYGTTYRAFGGGRSGEPSVSRVDDDIDSVKTSSLRRQTSRTAIDGRLNSVQSIQSDRNGKLR
jgi:hypothetical protein